ncbi:uncharacterized protein LOC119958433 isoform X2 [Scyliorhinus canicula]|uniref:uncharacterized protein LOC119958433 isoform X2 n=1 Tax=Scyliorhinus canicula TaxID=7830 RepID=UPI0018F54332|nr:uncharacterized protein LOC119958433 isoform X2 [Scyliorhinus canicula]
MVLFEAESFCNLLTVRVVRHSLPLERVLHHFIMFFNLLFLTLDDVQKLQSPTISIYPSDGELDKGNSARIECRTPSYHVGSTFYLLKQGKGTHMAEVIVPDGEETATFDLFNLTVEHQGQYRCYYRHKEAGQWKVSHVSNPVELTIRDDSLDAHSTGFPGIKNTWVLVGIVAGGVTLILIIIATVWCLCKKNAESRRRKNDGSSLWSAIDSKIGSPCSMNNRLSFRFSRGLETGMQEEGGSAYFANHSTEFLNDKTFVPRGSQKKPYFVTFREQ